MAISMVPIKDATAVAVKTAPLSMPAADRILGLTARMYAIVIKVVIPAMISVFTSVLCSLSLNSFSNMSVPPMFFIFFTQKFYQIFIFL